ncbi:MAG: c-type cytochrome [Thiobacillaceae bacterium]
MRYRRLTLLAIGFLITAPTQAADIEGIARACNNCHGTDGTSVGHSMPSIAGQSEAYLKNVMMQWKSGERASANMTRLIKGYTDEEIAGLAQYFSKLPWKPQVQTASADILKKGKEVTDACGSCHGVTGGEPGDADMPKLNGQWARYMELELMKYRDEGFKMTHKIMIKSARKLTAGDVEIAAKYYAAQSK